MPSDESKPRLLIVEDDVSALFQLRWTFDDCAVSIARNRSEALDQMRRCPAPVVLLDLGLPPDAEGASEGLAGLGEILALSPDTKVIVVTGREEREFALQAVELGAYDFYQKPVEATELRFLVERARRLQLLEEENRRLARDAKREPLPGIVCMSEGMNQVCRLIERAATSDIRVLLQGESGTGKEVLSRAIHLRSPRAGGPIVAINCAAIPEQLLESEFFGHERGAFTGASRRVVGRLELADGGTLLLDEIGDMSLVVQAKLLRFLQEGVIQRIGGRSDIALDTRILSATHDDLQARVAEGSFREDLYYRIAELTIDIPPLRERPEDAVLLAQHFFQSRHEGSARLQGLSADAVAAVARHTWPGNVRELENRMKRALVLAEGARITAADLDLGELASASRTSHLKQAVRETERLAVAAAWAEADGNVSKASQLLGVSRPTLYKLLKEHGLRE